MFHVLPRRTLDVRIYEGVRTKLTLTQIAEVALRKTTHNLTQREVDAVLHLWGC